MCTGSSDSAPSVEGHQFHTKASTKTASQSPPSPPSPSYQDFLQVPAPKTKHGRICPLPGSASLGKVLQSQTLHEVSPRPRGIGRGTNAASSTAKTGTRRRVRQVARGIHEAMHQVLQRVRSTMSTSLNAALSDGVVQSKWGCLR